MSLADMTSKEIRGIDMVVKGLSKKYPFVKGWEFDEKNAKWRSNLYLTIFVDWEEVSKYYNEPLSYIYKTLYSKEPSKATSSTFASFLGEKNFEYGTTDWDENINYWWQKGNEIKKSLNSLYEKLPSDYQIKWSTDLYPERLIPVRAEIENYSQKL